MSDTYAADWRWMLAFIRRSGGRATLNQIHAASVRERGTGLTPHSRADNIRKHLAAEGGTEELYACTWGRGENGKVEWLYWLGPPGLGRGARPEAAERRRSLVTAETWREVMEGAAA